MKRSRTTVLVLAAGVGGLTAVCLLRARRSCRSAPSRPAATEEPAGADLADRVRTALGPLEKELDLPRVHVFAERHVVVLHGEVPSLVAAHQVEDRVRRVPGVLGVESHLHVGLAPGDTRPSAGDTGSPARRALLSAAVRSGAGERAAPLASKAVLGTLAETLPASVAERLRSHVPPDVADLLQPPRRSGGRRDIGSLPTFLAAVVGLDALAPDRAPWVVDGVLHALRELVPEDDAAVAAALPTDLRHVWEEGRRAG